MRSYLESKGLKGLCEVYRNLPVPVLVEESLKRSEGVLSENGALTINTGKYTGRSPKDKFVVDTPDVHDDICWGSVNVPISEEKYDALYARVCDFLKGKDLFVFDGFAGADPKYRLNVRVINMQAVQNLFIHQVLLRPTNDELKNFDPQFTILAAPGFKCDPARDGVNSEAAIMINFKRKEVLICGTFYCGEIKKSVFSIMNYLLPKRDVFPMHCSANAAENGDTAIFFGLSGTGKTTLSADPLRKLIGDDEHGWSADGVFNIEGGCYAKCINLSKENEPQIWNAIKFGSVAENVVMDENRVFDFADESLTENTRAAYPVDFIPNCELSGVGGHPKAVIFLTADAFGVLPPVSKLTPEQAQYHFVSGYTARLAGTERGVTEPQATFSTCFGEPFLPLRPSVYAEMLGRRIAEYGSDVYLVNTGWSGGPPGVGKRMAIKLTRAMVTAALNGELAKSEFVNHPVFNVGVPTSCPGVPSEVLDTRKTWADKEAYDQSAQNLANLFVNNFKKYADMPQSIIDAGPRGK